MAVLTVTSTADSGAGSLRQALSDAASGDTIIFDTTTFPANVETSIYLESTINIPGKHLTIDGGETWNDNGALKTRVVLDGQNENRIFYFYSTAKYVLSGVTLKNGYTTGYSGAYYIIGSSDVTLNYCVVDSCSAAYGGAVYSSSATAVKINNCRFYNCIATTGGASIFLNTNGGAIINNCYFGATSSASNIHNNSTGGTLDFKGSANVDKFFLAASSATVIYGNLTVDSLTINAGASVTFDGVDAVLAITDTLTNNGATWTAAENSTGYIALPAGSTPPTVGANIVVGEYGANVQSVGASISENVATLTIVAQNTDKTYIVEGSSDGGITWTPLTLVDNKTTLASSKAYKFRTFDGSFVYSDVVPRVYYYKGAPTAGSFASASDWALDEGRTIVCSDAPTIKNGTFYCV